MESQSSKLMFFFFEARNCFLKIQSLLLSNMRLATCNSSRSSASQNNGSTNMNAFLFSRQILRKAKLDNAPLVNDATGMFNQLLR